MHDAARVEHVRELALRTERDGCHRVFFSASRPVRAAIVDANGTPRGETATATSGALPPRGPACARAGEALRVTFEPVTIATDGGSPAVDAGSAPFDLRAIARTSP
jgi:hypothetical protein